MIKKGTLVELDKLFIHLLGRKPDNIHLFEIIKKVPPLAKKAFDNLNEPNKPIVIVKAMIFAHHTENYNFIKFLWEKLQPHLKASLCQKLLKYYQSDRSDFENENYQKLITEIRNRCENILDNKRCCDVFTKNIIEYYSEARYK